MKRSDLRKIIKEEYVNIIRILNEAFADPIASKLTKMGGLNTRWKSFWHAAANTYDIAWDKVPKGSFRKVTNASQAKQGMAFYVVVHKKDNPYKSSRWSDDIIYPGVLAVTIDNKIQYFQEVGGSRFKTGQMKIGAKKTGYRSSSPGDAVGKGGRGMLMNKKIAALADVIYVFDLESYRGGTTALKAKRADLKSGADDFKDHKKWKQANIQRYKAMLNDKVGSRDQVDKMVGEIVKMANDSVGQAMTLPKVGQYGDLIATISGKEVALKDITREMNNALDYYSRYIRSENEDAAFLKKYPEYAKEKPTRHSVEARKDAALSIRKILTDFKRGNVRW